jgi:DNA modification methylase
VLLRMCDKAGFFLAQELYWNNPSKLPSPIEWVNKRKLRMKDSVNTVWWFSKTEWPKADVSKVLAPYSDRMKKLLKDPEAFYTPKKRPSGHDIGIGFGKDNGGAIPSNLINLPNTESDGFYDASCKLVGTERHPALSGWAAPALRRMCTDPGDVVLDVFAGFNVTGQVAEMDGRKWLAFDLSKEYLAGSAFRFMTREMTPEAIRDAYERIARGECVHIPDVVPQGSILALKAAE